MVKEAGIVLVESTDPDAILSNLSDDDLKRVIQPTDSFSVKTQ